MTHIYGDFKTANELGNAIEDFVPYQGRPSKVTISPESFLALGGTDLGETLSLTTTVVQADATERTFTYEVGALASPPEPFDDESFEVPEP